MKKSSVLIFLSIFGLILIANSLHSQNTLKRWVFGSGGSVMLENQSSGNKLSGMLGQTAIFTRESDNILHQGFWVLDSTLVGVDDDPVTLSSELMNFPNPFSNYTTIRYITPGTGFVTIRIFDMVGRLRKTLVNATQSAGQQEVIWDGKDNNGYDCAAGSYLYDLSVNPYRASGDGQFDEIHLRNVMVIVR